jgi:RNA polymerase sigma-70 factor (ECF subfamily)
VGVVSDEVQDLIQRAGHGESVAVDALLERHLPGLRKYVRQRISPALLSKESTSDVVQSVCREVLQGAGSFEYRGEAAFRGWLYQTALRKLVDHLRHFESQKRDGAQIAASTLSSADFALIASALHSPSKDAMLREQVESLERGVTRLNSEDQLVLRLIYVEGLSHAAAARRLDCTEAASRKHLSRALARLARMID